MAHLSSDTLIMPSSLGIMTAELTTSWKASILLSRHGFRACGCGWISDAMGCTRTPSAKGSVCRSPAEPANASWLSAGKHTIVVTGAAEAASQLTQTNTSRGAVSAEQNITSCFVFVPFKIMII